MFGTHTGLLTLMVLLAYLLEGELLEMVEM
jgi:hypothetical protein